jgi:hypothetical protein
MSNGCGERHLLSGSYFFFALALVFPSTRCKLKLLRMERIKDYLLIEEEFVQNQERLKPQEEKNQVRYRPSNGTCTEA